MGVVKQLSWLGNTIKASAVIPAQAGIHKPLILIVDKVTGFRPAPE